LSRPASWSSGVLADADVLLYFTTPKFTAQALRKVGELGWKPQQILASPTNSVEGVMKPAGLDSTQGALTTQFTRQAGDPAWASDPQGLRDLPHAAHGAVRGQLLEADRRNIRIGEIADRGRPRREVSAALI
jgi:hypothetical protein